MLACAAWPCLPSHDCCTCVFGHAVCEALCIGQPGGVKTALLLLAEQRSSNAFEDLNSTIMDLLQCPVQCIWDSMSTFFLDDDCSSWAARGPSSGIGPLLAAGAQLQNSVTLLLDHGGATVDLRLVDTQDQQRESACHFAVFPVTLILCTGSSKGPIRAPEGVGMEHVMAKLLVSPANLAMA